MSKSFILPKLECRGSATELGRAQGEAFREEIRGFIRQRLDALRDYMAERGTPDVAGFLATGRQCFEIAEAWDTEAALELRGIAEAAGVDVYELYSVGNMTDVRDVLLLPAPPDDEGCSAFILPPALTASGKLMAGQTWDLNPTDLDFVVAVHRRPLEGPETWSITCVGCLSLMGMNAEGVAVGTTNIKVRGSRPGVGYLSLLHRALRSETSQAAARWIREAPRAAAHTYWIVDANSAVEYECSTRFALERRIDQAPLCRTNHSTATEHADLEGEAPTASSQRRLERLAEILGQGQHTQASLQNVFADRSCGVDSINRYPEDAQGTTTNACMLCVPAERRLWACKGPADRGEWFELAFS